MIRVTFTAPDGQATTIEAEDGQSVMQAAVAHDIDGIVGECGGAMMCATCHCYVDAAWTARTGGPSPDEAEMLEGAAAEVDDRSRLSCQIRLGPGLYGLVVHLPEEQM
ncbi:(2Fe-2S)-binding protein [Paracoccus aestuarii]|uniref:(2Fe-2S)-binding protein n=1 Tax=Paracoccus aestuarii TaxID=453842 RepID=A0A418ZSY7_9RHOB|nr:2Fe-2S iron-sulfur cluster-binding protein [Paracoccus aestuarii]RJL01148.1 (2Fe-2S)-binding protein [Paracoccus aestuarii]WCR01248.1 2Fe-2S iron-sulfur cluster binding domain-containing protein [Paracoccus aestuarii]